MIRRVLTSLVVSAACAGVLAAASTSTSPAADPLVVHEWGTFTSVAGPDGTAVEWSPLGGPEDLPCFIDRARPAEIGAAQIGNILVKGPFYGQLSALPGAAGINAALTSTRAVTAAGVPAPLVSGRIRMETPVLYFYSPEAAKVDVKVAFRQGAMSEWYPKAIVPRLDIGRPLAATTDTIEWKGVEVRPGPDQAYPSDGSKSHYYAARAVDAAPLRVGSQDEKFLFYRGVADFQPLLTAVVEPEGAVTVDGPAASMRMILFEKRADAVGYRVVESVGRTRIERPALTGTAASIRRDLTALLTDEGLYPREAAAMVETWRDSWFEEGLRVFYILPRTAVDDRLPLTITPAPAAIARVFVGRLELITDDMKNDVERALVTGDLDTLNMYGRFLDSIVAQIANRPSLAANPAKVADALRALAKPWQAAAVSSCGRS